MVACGGDGSRRALCRGADRPATGGKHLLDLALGVGVCARAKSVEKKEEVWREVVESGEGFKRFWSGEP